jgi:hypothetical protein
MLDGWLPPLRDGLTLAGESTALSAGDVAAAFYGDLFRVPGRPLSGDSVPPYTAADVTATEADLLMLWWAEAVATDPTVVSPDARTLAAWDLGVGRCLRRTTLRPDRGGAGHGGTMTIAGAVQDDRPVAVASPADDTLRLWDLRTWRISLVTRAGMHVVSAVDCPATTGGLLVVTGGADGTLQRRVMTADPDRSSAAVTRADRDAGRQPGRGRRPRGGRPGGDPRTGRLSGNQASASMAKVLPSGSWNHAMRPPPARAVIPLASCSNWS